MFKNSFMKSAARFAALGTALAAVQLVAPAAQAAPGDYPNTVPTVTNLTLGTNLAQYGQITRATVTVKPAGNVSGTPDGDVRLRVQGQVTMVKNLRNGRVTFTLPRRLQAQKTYGIVATYLRESGSDYMRSRDTAFYTVDKARTIASANARNIKRGQRPTVNVDLKSATGLTPGGSVRVRLVKSGDVRRSKTVRLHGGDAHVTFGKVKARGKWTAKVTYLGTSNFRRDTTSDGFRVTRR